MRSVYDDPLIQDLLKRVQRARYIELCAGPRPVTAEELDAVNRRTISETINHGWAEYVLQVRDARTIGTVSARA